MNKKQWFNVLYWSISGIVMWFILFMIAYFMTKQSLKDALTVASVILMGSTLLVMLLKLGLFEKTIVKYRNSKFNITSQKKYHQKMTINQYHAILKNRAWWPLFINLILYLIILIVAIFIN